MDFKSNTSHEFIYFLNCRLCLDKMIIMNKNIIVTGGAQGIGRIISLELLKNGFNVSVFDIDAEAISEFREEIDSENIAFFQTDVSNEADVRKSITASIDKFGAISGLIN